MVNSELSEISYVIQAGVTTYPIGFEYHFNENNSPQLLVKIGESVAIINVDFQLSSDESEIILIPTEEEARAQISPSDTRWMDRIVGKELLITRDIPFVQTSDYSVGRINPEQIEYDFDRAVMRDQEILHQLSDFTVDVALAESLANAAVETANEAATAANQATATANTALDTANTAVVTANEAKATATQASQDAVDAMADAASVVNKADAADMTATTAMEIAAEAATIAQGAEAAVANKQDKLVAGQGITIDGNTISATDGYNKTEIDNKISVIEADIDANADAIQKTRADFIAADSDIHTILNNHASELTTLHNDVDEVGDQVSGIEEKIPGTASASNHLITKQQLLDEEMDIREDMNETDGQLQTQITAQAAAIAGKQDKLSAGHGIKINESTNTIWAEFPTHVSSINGYDGNILLEPGDGISFENITGTLGSGWKISATASGGGSEYTAGNGIEITDNTISVDSSVFRNIGGANSFEGIAIGNEHPVNDQAITVGANALAVGVGGITIGVRASSSGKKSICIGHTAYATGDYTIQLGDGDNEDPNTFKVANENGNFEMMSADGTIPAARMSTTAGTAGQVLTKTDNGMAWQDSTGGGGGASLPDQTGNAGKFLTTDGESVSWSEYLYITRNSVGVGTTNTPYSAAVAVGGGATASASGTIASGYNTRATAACAIAMGASAKATADNAIQLGTNRWTGGYTNSDANTFKVGNANGNFEMMSADGTIPAARHATLPVADGTYVLKLSIVDGVPTLGWVAE